MPTEAAHQIIAALPIPALVLDREARISETNAASTALLGAPLRGRQFVTVVRHAAINQAVDAVLGRPGASAPTPDPTLREVESGGHRLRVQISAQGRDVPCEVTVSPLEFCRGALVVIEDSSAIEQAGQMRRDFVANVSHELRTPLTALMGFIETLRGPARNDENARDEFLSIMEREASRMNRLVHDLLSLSRVESEERRRPAQSLDLTALVQGVIETLTPHARSRGVEIAFDASAGAVMLPGDPDQLAQVFHNLIENATKYGAAGKEVTITITRIEREPVLRGPAWAVAVTDRGEGIDPIHLPRLTERFYRVDTHRSRQQGGTGLGLAIVKHIINRHRGRLRIESEPGKGASFTVILPERQDRR